MDKFSSLLAFHHEAKPSRLSIKNTRNLPVNKRGVLILLSLKECNKCKVFVNPPGYSEWARIKSALSGQNIAFKYFCCNNVEELDNKLPNFFSGVLNSVPLLVYMSFAEYSKFFKYTENQEDSLINKNGSVTQGGWSVFGYNMVTLKKEMTKQRTKDNIVEWITRL